MKLIIFSILYALFHTLFFIQCSYGSDHEHTAAWVVRWHIDSPSKINSICNEASNKFDTLLVQVRGRADAYYMSDLAPRAEELKKQKNSFDPLAALLSQCKENEIHAWVNVFYLWTGETLPESPTHPAQPTNTWIIKDNNGNSVSNYTPLKQAQGWIEGVYADPASLAYRQNMLQIVKEIVETYPVTGIHLDFIRYPGLSYGYDSVLSQQFLKKYGFDPKWLPDRITHEMAVHWLNGSMPLSERVLTTGTLIWAAMRAEAVTEMVKGIRRVINGANKEIILSAAIFPDQLSAFITKGQDWQEWAQNKLVDQLYPMTYFGEKERVSRQLHTVANSINNTNISLWAGLGAYIKDATEIEEEVNTISPLTYKGISLFSLGHIQNKKGASAPYYKAINTWHQNTKKSVPGNSNYEIPSYHKEVLDIVRAIKTLTRKEFETNEAGETVKIRKNEFLEAANTVIPSIIKELQHDQIHTPPSLDMRGFFRYVHPFDSEEKIQDQRKIIEETRALIEKGHSPYEVAKKYSQAGGRSFGAPLPRRYVSNQDKDGQALLQLKPGEFSQTHTKSDGFWFYQLLEKNIGESRSYKDIPWPARRVLLQDTLFHKLAIQ